MQHTHLCHYQRELRHVSWNVIIIVTNVKTKHNVAKLKKNHSQQTVQYENVTAVVQNVRLWLECMPSVRGLPFSGFRSVQSVSRNFLSK